MNKHKMLLFCLLVLAWILQKFEPKVAKLFLYGS